MELLRDLDKFLTDLIRVQHLPAKPLPAPNVPADRAIRLYGLIADEYREEAVELVNARRWVGAERVLAKVLHLVPEFSAPNYLYTICLLSQGKEPERAIEAAQIAARDPLLPDAELLLSKAREMKEVLTINAAYEEHNKAVRAAGSPPTREQLILFRRAMERLRDRMPKLRAIATTTQSRQRVQDLATAVASQQEEIDKAEAQLEIAPLVERFNEWAQQMVNGPRYGRSTVDARLEGMLITREADRLKRTNPQASQVLQEMINVIDRAGQLW
jgi:uncharacterized coiled-coil protein SlyX